MNNYILADLLIVLISIMLLILIFFKINALIRGRNNNLNKVNKELGELICEITEEINILNEDTTGIVIDEVTTINNENSISYFEVTSSVVIMNSNFII